MGTEKTRIHRGRSKSSVNLRLENGSYISQRSLPRNHSPYNQSTKNINLLTGEHEGVSDPLPGTLLVTTCRIFGQVSWIHQSSDGPPLGSALCHHFFRFGDIAWAVSVSPSWGPPSGSTCHHRPDHRRCHWSYSFRDERSLCRPLLLSASPLQFPVPLGFCAVHLNPIPPLCKVL